jgi:dTMP kinase
MQKGRFITFEGCEGTGKSTQALLFKQYLESRNIKVILTREPGGTELGKAFRELILDPSHANLTAKAELFLYFADRAQHVDELILPALQEGVWVISDRFADATFAYQGGGRGFDLSFLTMVNHFAASSLNPDLTFLLDIDTRIGLERARKNRKEFLSSDGDRMEQEKLGFHEKVRKAYLSNAALHTERILVIDASGNVEDVHRKILSAYAKSGKGIF